MTYKVSVLRGSKDTPKLVTVTEIFADRFVLNDGDRLFGNGAGVYFYNDEKGLFGGVKSSALVALFPGAEWIVTQG